MTNSLKEIMQLDVNAPSGEVTPKQGRSSIADLQGRVANAVQATGVYASNFANDLTFGAYGLFEDAVNTAATLAVDSNNPSLMEAWNSVRATKASRNEKYADAAMAGSLSSLPVHIAAGIGLLPKTVQGMPAAAQWVLNNPNTGGVLARALSALGIGAGSSLSTELGANRLQTPMDAVKAAGFGGVVPMGLSVGGDIATGAADFAASKMGQGSSVMGGRASRLAKEDLIGNLVDTHPKGETTLQTLLGMDGPIDRGTILDMGADAARQAPEGRMNAVTLPGTDMPLGVLGPSVSRQTNTSGMMRDVAREGQQFLEDAQDKAADAVEDYLNTGTVGLYEMLEDADAIRAAAKPEYDRILDAAMQDSSNYTNVKVVSDKIESIFDRKPGTPNDGMIPEEFAVYNELQEMIGTYVSTKENMSAGITPKGLLKMKKSLDIKIGKAMDKAQESAIDASFVGKLLELKKTVNDSLFEAAPKLKPLAAEMADVLQDKGSFELGRKMFTTSTPVGEFKHLVGKMDETTKRHVTAGFAEKLAEQARRNPLAFLRSVGRSSRSDTMQKLRTLTTPEQFEKLTSLTRDMLKEYDVARLAAKSNTPESQLAAAQSDDIVSGALDLAAVISSALTGNLFTTRGVVPMRRLIRSNPTAFYQELAQVINMPTAQAQDYFTDALAAYDAANIARAPLPEYLLAGKAVEDFPTALELGSSLLEEDEEPKQLLSLDELLELDLPTEEGQAAP